MQARSVAANSARATVRVPHQAATMTIVTARNSAVNSIGRAPGKASQRRILDEPSPCATLNANTLRAQPVLHNSFHSPVMAVGAWLTYLTFTGDGEARNGRQSCRPDGDYHRR